MFSANITNIFNISDTISDIIIGDTNDNRRQKSTKIQVHPTNDTCVHTNASNLL